MTIKLYGSTHSPFVHLVALVAAQAGVQIEFVALEAGVLKTAGYLEIQPFGQLPYIDDEGFVLYESQAIARYLATKAPQSCLVPPISDLQA